MIDIHRCFFQDVKAFSDEDFDVKNWINNVFKNPEAAGNKEQYAQSLVMKLQLLIAKLNANLEDQSEQILLNMPKVIREVESLQQDSVLLKSSMMGVQSDIDKVNRETGDSMETLVQMDLLKQRILATKKALKEADNWTTLNNEIEDAFDQGKTDLVLISSKLNGIQGSLKILSHVPDFEDRVILVEGLKNRLEALASPQLVAAFNNCDKEKSKFFVQIFSDMDRSNQLLKYYRKCVRAKALKTWSNTVEDNEQMTYLQWISSFTQHLTKQLDEQVRIHRNSLRNLLHISVFEFQVVWFKEVFPEANAPENLIEILVDVFLSLDPGQEFCLNAGLKQQSDQLTYLIQVKQILNNFLSFTDELLVTSHSGNLDSEAMQNDLNCN